MLEATSLGRVVRFPAVKIDSAEAFRAFRADQSDLLDERYRRERALATSAAHLVLEGTCAICLSASEFVSATEDGEPVGNGAVVPNWREHQVCGCAFRLGAKYRALLHCADLGADLAAPGLFGADPPLERYLAALRCPPAVWGVTGWRLPDRSLDVVLSVDWLQRVPALDVALRDIARVLMPGGECHFTVPFHVNQDHTMSDFSGLSARQAGSLGFVGRTVHAFGWDLIARVVGAGFENCLARCFWSEELGYLGPFNLVFSATR